MQVARPNFLGKTSALSVSRPSQTPCHGNWMRLVLQGIFATITVASFILIVIMAVKNPNPAPALRPTIPPRCNIYGCRVVCSDAPYFDRYEEDILFAVSDAEAQCSRVVLELNRPYFINGTLPQNWLSRMRSNIYQLAIIRGNLREIQDGAFMTQFAGHIVILVLHGLDIIKWESTGLVGLSSLRTINIMNTYLNCVHENVLRPVDDTLETLTITEAGAWDPYNFTGKRGFEKLTIVDFSHNDFNDVLGPMTFVGLEVTRILYLNSCRITAIAVGTFDHLLNIEVLYLNNNMLVTVAPGLFNTLVTLDNPRPRVNLQDNFWLCDCSAEDLRQLIRKDILLVDPTCTYPSHMHSLTFTKFEDICNLNDTSEETEANESNSMNIINKNNYYFLKSDTTSQFSYFMPAHINVDANASFCNGRSNNSYVRIISSGFSKKCTSSKMRHLNATALSEQVIRQNTTENKSVIWPLIYFFLMTDKYSIIQIISMNNHNKKYGLVWFQPSCPNELYCLEEIPNYLRIYNADLDAHYTFCLMNLDTARIINDDCIGYDFSTVLSEHDIIKSSRTKIVVYFILSMLTCLCSGAVIVYGLIRAKPTLLRGSKRVLFVKHKNVEALVLPPKVPIRNDWKPDVNDSKKEDIFTLSPGKNLKPTVLNRIKSVKSNKSGSPSYISAMQPTEDQLAEWRIRHHFNNDLTVNSMKSELSTLSWICGDTYYRSLNESDMTYESLK